MQWRSHNSGSGGQDFYERKKIMLNKNELKILKIYNSKNSIIF
jgi:hypothetical protein